MQTINSATLLSRAIEQRGFILGQWLTEQSLSMIYAPRGLGKTNFCLWLACSVAAGKKFLHWDAQQKRKVLYIDSEMCLSELKNRVEHISLSLQDNFNNLRFVSPDLLETSSLPDLSVPDGQEIINTVIGDAELIVIDNLSSLLRKKPNSWLVVQDWLLKLKRQRKAVLIVHHANKLGAQRGSSRHEDAMDCVIALKKSDGYSITNGCQFDLRFEKCRSLISDDIKPLHCALQNNAWQWEVLYTRDEQARNEFVDEFTILLNGFSKRLSKVPDSTRSDFINHAHEYAAAIYIFKRGGDRAQYRIARKVANKFVRGLSLSQFILFYRLARATVKIFDGHFGKSSQHVQPSFKIKSSKLKFIPLIISKI